MSSCLFRQRRATARLAPRAGRAWLTVSTAAAVSLKCWPTGRRAVAMPAARARLAQRSLCRLRSTRPPITYALPASSACSSFGESARPPGPGPIGLAAHVISRARLHA